jgi:cell division septation protein DedD
MSRDAADRLIHVRIGPFSNRNEANAMRDKLLGDGYNAMVQP